MRKAGRFTAALLLVAVGSSVILDRFAGTQFTTILIDWWPVLFIALGLEYILFNMKYGESDNQLKLDFGGVVFAVLLSAVVIGSTQSAESFRNVFGHLNMVDSMSTAAGEERKFDKPVMSVPLPSGVDRVFVSNEGNGNVTIKSGNVAQLQIDTTVYVALNDEKQAAEIADQSKVTSSISGNSLHLAMEGKKYGGALWNVRKPRIDVIITVPAQAQINIEAELTNGRFEAEQLTLKQRMKASTTNGVIVVSSIQGDLDLQSTNGSIKSSQTKGRLQLETSNGTVEAVNHQGDAKIHSTNGALKTDGVTGSIDAETTNGSIIVAEAPQSLKAQTTNGSVEVTSHTVNGNWDVETSNGKINLKLPSKGDYTIKGEGKKGGVESNLPLQIGKNSIDGKIGSGKHTIKLQTRGYLSIRTVDGL